MIPVLWFLPASPKEAARDPSCWEGAVPALLSVGLGAVRLEAGSPTGFPFQPDACAHQAVQIRGIAFVFNLLLNAVCLCTEMLLAPSLAWISG